MVKLYRRISLTAIIFLTFAVQSLTASEAQDDLRFGPKLQTIAPSITTKDTQGKTFDLGNAIEQGPVVLVFYRGGWCPYCNRQLRRLQKEVEPELKKANGQLVAISVDRLDESVKTQKKLSANFTVISDPKANVVKRYNVAYTVPDELVATYKKEHGIDVEASSGETHHIIAIPSVFVVGPAKKITYRFAMENYKLRAPEKQIVKAIKETASEYGDKSDHRSKKRGGSKSDEEPKK